MAGKFALLLIALLVAFAYANSLGCKDQAAPVNSLDGEELTAVEVYSGSGLALQSVNEIEAVTLGRRARRARKARAHHQRRRGAEKEKYDKWANGATGDNVDKTHAQQCQNKFYYCTINCQHDFKVCNHSKRFILYVPREEHVRLCITPRLSNTEWYNKLSSHDKGKCLTRACSCTAYQEYFKQNLPILYAEKMQEYKTKCAGWCQTNQKPNIFHTRTQARVEFESVRNAISKFADSIKKKKNLKKIGNKEEANIFAKAMNKKLKAKFGILQKIAEKKDDTPQELVPNMKVVPQPQVKGRFVFNPVINPVKPIENPIRVVKQAPPAPRRRRGRW